jgi:hypothetical protein
VARTLAHTDFSWLAGAVVAGSLYFAFTLRSGRGDRATRAAALPRS